MRDYREWHRDYEDPDSALSQRLRVVQRRLAEGLSEMPPGPIGLISMCAGQGRDVIGVLPNHPRGRDVRALLVELDPSNAHWARDSARQAGLDGVTVLQGDAAISDAYRGAAPADILLACGIFGNITDADLENTVRHLSMLCRPGAYVIWTRHHKDPGLIEKIRQWFSESGFEDLGFDALENERKMGIGSVRLAGPPLPFQSGFRFFTFIR